MGNGPTASDSRFTIETGQVAPGAPNRIDHAAYAG